MNECMLWGEENAAAIRRITFVRTYAVHRECTNLCAVLSLECRGGDKENLHCYRDSCTCK